MIQKPYNFELQNPKVLVILRWVHFEIQNTTLLFENCAHITYMLKFWEQIPILYILILLVTWQFPVQVGANIVHNTYHTICILSESLECKYRVVWLYYNITNVFLWNNNALIVRNIQRTGKLLEGDHINHYDMDCQVYIMKKC